MYLGVIEIQEFQNQLYLLKFSPQLGEKDQKGARNFLQFGSTIYEKNTFFWITQLKTPITQVWGGN